MDDKNKIDKPVAPAFVPAVKAEPKPETVEIPKSQFDGIMDRLADLEQGKKDRTSGLHDGRWQKVVEGDKTKTATMRLNDEGNYAVDWWHLKTEFNERTREKDMVYTIKWLTPDDKFVETEMKLVDFVNSVPRQEVKLVKKDTTKLRQVVGRTRRVEVDYANYRSKAKEEVDMAVTMDDTTYTVELADGRKIQLKEDRLNA